MTSLIVSDKVKAVLRESLACVSKSTAVVTKPVDIDDNFWLIVSRRSKMLIQSCLLILIGRIQVSYES